MVLGTPLRRLRQRPVVDGVVDPQRQAEFAAGGYRKMPYTLGSMVGGQPDTLEQRLPGHPNQRPMDAGSATMTPLAMVREGSPLAGMMTDLTRPIRPNGVPIYPGMSPEAAAAATASLAEKLNAAQRVYPGSAQRNYGSYGMRPTQESRYMSNLGERADAISVGARPQAEIPLTQQGFARSQGFGAGGQVLPGANLPAVYGLPENGPKYGQEQRGDLGPKNEYGLRSGKNFSPMMTPEMAAQGTDGPLGTFGGSTLQRMNGRHVLVGNGDGGPATAPLNPSRLRDMQRQATKNMHDPNTQSGKEFAARVEREKAKNAVAAQEKSDLKTWARARKLRLPLDAGVATRLGGGESAGGKGPYNLSTNELTSLHDPQRQGAHRAGTGVAPLESSADDVLGAINNRFPSLSDGKSREQVIKTIRAWTMGPQGQKAPKDIREWVDGWIKHQESGSKKPYDKKPPRTGWSRWLPGEAEFGSAGTPAKAPTPPPYSSGPSGQGWYKNPGA